MAELTLTLPQLSRLCAVLGLPEDDTVGRYVRSSLKLGSFENKRHAPRLLHRAAVRLSRMKREQVLPAEPTMLEDFSTGGVTLIHPSAVKPGNKVVVYFGNEEKPLHIVGNVLHCRSQNGKSVLGVAFEELFDPAVELRDSA